MIATRPAWQPPDPEDEAATRPGEEPRAGIKWASQLLPRTGTLLLGTKEAH